MNKEDVVIAIAQETGLTKMKAETVLETFLRMISDTLVSGGKIQFAGFGTFECKKRAARVGRNPRTNIPVSIPERNVPVFKPSSILKIAVANGK